MLALIQVGRKLFNLRRMRLVLLKLMKLRLALLEALLKIMPCLLVVPELNGLLIA
jgi:hypothetical protein